MKVLSYNLDEKEVFNRIRMASQRGIWDGLEPCPYLEECRWMVEKFSCVLIFSRDTGYHSSGWWKNPDYERCYHLSISFPGGKNKAHLNKIIDALFGWNKKLLWIEPPYSLEGKQAEVWHYRLFCDISWQPIKPRSEVYSTQFTERGWKSFSQLHFG